MLLAGVKRGWTTAETLNTPFAHLLLIIREELSRDDKCLGLETVEYIKSLTNAGYPN